MLYTLSELYALSLRGRDGDLGHVTDVYTDTRDGVIRYLFADTSAWLGRPVAVSPFSLQRIYPESAELRVDLTRERVRASPRVADPVTRRYENEFNVHYGYPSYRSGGCTWGAGNYPLTDNASLPASGRDGGFHAAQHTATGPVVLSANALCGCAVEATDGPLGRLETIVFDDVDWRISAIVVDGRRAWPEKKLLVPAQWLAPLGSVTARVAVMTGRSRLKEGAGFDLPVAREGRRERVEAVSRDLRAAALSR